MLFATNVAAILASGIVVMALYRTSRASGQATGADFRRPFAVVIIVLLLAAVLVPLWINSEPGRQDHGPAGRRAGGG